MCTGVTTQQTEQVVKALQDTVTVHDLADALGVKYHARQQRW